MGATDEEGREGTIADFADSIDANAVFGSGRSRTLPWKWASSSPA